MKPFQILEIILYVNNQDESTAFYSKLFRRNPDLNVPGMTSFTLSENCKLGLMPNSGIAKILKDKMPHPDSGKGIPRCEMYFFVDDIHKEFDCALALGATLISSIEDRDWGDKVCYFADLDGHIIAFAEPINRQADI